MSPISWENLHLAIYIDRVYLKSCEAHIPKYKDVVDRQKCIQKLIVAKTEKKVKPKIEGRMIFSFK